MPNGQRGTAFNAVCKGVPDDANGHIGLGRAKLEEARLLLATNQNDAAGGKLREVLVAGTVSQYIDVRHMRFCELLLDLNHRVRCS